MLKHVAMALDVLPKYYLKNLDKKEIKILSDAGILHASKIDELNISVNLGKLSHGWEKIPLLKNIDTLNIPIQISGFENGV